MKVQFILAIIVSQILADFHEVGEILDSSDENFAIKIQELENMANHHLIASRRLKKLLGLVLKSKLLVFFNENELMNSIDSTVSNQGVDPFIRSFNHSDTTITDEEFEQRLTEIIEASDEEFENQLSTIENLVQELLETNTDFVQNESIESNLVILLDDAYNEDSQSLCGGVSYDPTILECCPGEFIDLIGTC